MERAWRIWPCSAPAPRSGARAYDEPVLNPLTLPQAVIDGLAILPALLKEAQAANRTLAEASTAPTASAPRPTG